MKRVAVLGGGPAGAFAAERLASAGLDTVVLDDKLAWEKPCGGGITSKAYEYDFTAILSYLPTLCRRTIVKFGG